MSQIETFQIHLSSQNADKIIDGNNCNVEYYLPIIEVPSQYHIYASVQHAVIPFTFYNVNSSNNVLRYTVQITPYQLTITPGNYNINTLKAFLLANMPNFSIYYNGVTNQFTFNHSTYGFTFLSSSTCLSLLGFLPQNNVSTIQSLTSNRAVNLAPIRCICIGTNLKTFNIDKTAINNQSIICSIPITTQPYSIITYQNHNNFRVNTFSNTISTLAIKLMDQTGQLLDMNGANWTMTIQFDIVDFVN